MEMFVDSSSFMQDSIKNAIILAHTSKAQKAEFITLLRALDLAKGKRDSIWTDSKFAFGVVLAHGAIWKQGATKLPGNTCKIWRNDNRIVRRGVITKRSSCNALQSPPIK